MPRFVVLMHETREGNPRGTHWDLMFEAEGVLRTWALPALPAAGESTMAEQLADHRLMYLDYEGEVSGGRGSVRRVAQGTYVTREDSAGRLVVRLSGGELSGTMTLGRDADTQRWRVSLSED